MANTPREFSAYIVVGVVEQGGRPTQIVGVSDHFDPSELDRQMEGRVNCVPSISYHVVDHEGHEVGIYEVRADPRGPFVALRKFGRLDPGAIYFRRNSQNAVATNRQDIERITAWFTGVESSAPPQPAATMSWQQFYRVCDGFDESRSYICVIDEKVHATIDDWRSFAAFGWDLVIDFDVDTDESGAFSKSRETLSKLRSLKLTALDGDLPVVGSGATLWIAARGVRSRPSTVLADGWRDWHRKKVEELRRSIDAVARLTDVRPTTLIVFGGESSYIRTVCEHVDASFQDRVDFVFASPGESQLLETIEMFDGAHTPISFGEACQHIGGIRGADSQTTGIEIPKLEGGVALVPPDRARWIEEEFELVHLPAHSVREDTQTEIRGFHRGMQVSWYGLNAGADVYRDALEEVGRRVNEGLIARSVRRVDLAHWPGAGDPHWVGERPGMCTGHILPLLHIP